MNGCPQCASFVPAHVCPECDLRLPAPRDAGPGWVRRAVNAAVSAGAVLTLAACYGVPYEDEYCPDPSSDADGDGYCGEFDCDEGDPERHDFAYDEPGDGVDQDCDGADAIPTPTDGGPTGM